MTYSDYIDYMASWGLAEAKAKFSEVVDCAVNQEPQEITRNGKSVAVLVAREEWLRSKRSVDHNHRSMAEFFRNSPLKNSGLDLRRARATPRKIDL